MKIAITGATGYIGSVLTPLLLEAGHELRLLARRQQFSREGITFVYGTLLDEAAIGQLVSGADAVIHLAAMISVSDRPDGTMFHVNTTGTRILAAAAKAAGVKRFLHLSSVTAYNQYPYDTPLDEYRGPSDALQYGYDHSKAVSQAIALEYNGNGMEVLALAPTAVIGPYDRQPSLIGKAVINIYRGRIPALFPGGVDFVDVRDVTDAIIQALTKGKGGEAYLLSGCWLSLTELSEQIGKAKGKKISLPVLPLWFITGILPLVRGWSLITGGPPYYTRQSIYNLIRSNKKICNSKARNDLRFNPRPISVTIEDTIDWFRQTGKIK
ncbi:MAG TPA: NAD-dependent epimerase/dehydratase family protein [Chitinophaga sp.]|uniref:NAD-dependent epimerase/dehydratase family protein n=1 Tax=Chitinophaga sp. TaxID=1869181 RepID=UPI002C187D41|nr:NAD-dependent epimerase/dehydratase family protein [Chitinophaga sp.]HVI48618.1 NAD-dependent epimerase/dehydratase family protein [Chitinophaga sp.]